MRVDGYHDFDGDVIDFVKIEPCENPHGISRHIGTTAEGTEWLIPEDLFRTRWGNLWKHPNREQEMLKNWDSADIIENV